VIKKHVGGALYAVVQSHSMPEMKWLEYIYLCSTIRK